MSTFEAIFGFAPQASAHAPGRVNLLGEHTDYNEGYVLPTTIPQTTRVDAALSRDNRYRFYAANLGEHIEYDDAGVVVRRDGYERYVRGCIEMLKRRGDAVPPVTLYITSDVPMGGGLSSSAALEVAVLRALRQLLDLSYDDLELARLAQQAEIDYAGVHCGILDQMACSLGDREHMLFLDTRSLEQRLLPLPAGDLIVIDSGVPRTLATSGYNERRAECERAARLLGVSALRDVTDVDACNRLPPPLNRRARHVVTENARVLAAVDGVDGPRFGELMNASHASLRDDYEVSIAALDDLVRLLQEHPQVYGARLTGAGFGGACVALGAVGATEDVKRSVLDAYAQTGRRGSVLV
jgi:galactokinase